MERIHKAYDTELIKACFKLLKKREKSFFGSLLILLTDMHVIQSFLEIIGILKNETLNLPQV